MIVDSHCHAWLRWPYAPPVPDVESRGRVEQLIFEMDRNGVERAVLVCARIDRNPDNNDYGAGCVKRFPDRLDMFADVDCSWWETYQAPGAADRLVWAADAYPMKGFTHYVKGNDDGSWYLGPEGTRFFEKTQELNLIVSLAAGPGFQHVVRQLADRFPDVPFLCHHMAGAMVGDVRGQAEVLKSSSKSNVYIKMSGFAYVVPDQKWEYPYHETHDVVRALYEAYGADRLCWGSDYPVVRNYMTHKQTLEAFRIHCDFIPEVDRETVLGPALIKLLDAARDVQK
ncbi:MAG: amidohydrolase family protein [Candidatus Latescibacterota bacterium]|nr:amidohydrolase family protein [Candidatus Latescibacterota bacterium]